jgi:dihydropteridine reductase
MKSIVIGGAGAFGRVLVRDLKMKGFNPISIDFAQNADASDNLIVKANVPLREQVKGLLGDVADRVGADGSLKGVFCSAGGWAGGYAGDDNFLDALHQMNSMNLESAALAAHISCKHLAPSGLLLLTGAEAALRPTPSMLAYGLSKVSTHFLLQSVAHDPAFMKKNASALAMVPCTIDTPMNRTYMADADHSSWTKPEDISRRAMRFLEDEASRPESGSMLAVYTAQGVNTWKVVRSLGL